MSNPILGFPILLERVDADFPCGTDIWMENLGGEPTCREREDLVQPNIEKRDKTYTLEEQLETRS